MALQFTDAQKKLSLALMNGPLSLEQLVDKTNGKTTEVQDELKLLMQLKLISLQGTPPHYVLAENVIQELKRRKSIESEDDNLFRVQIMIEVQGVEEELVKRQAEKILENLRKEPFFKIYTHKMEKTEKVDEKYSTFVEVNLSVRDFRGIVRLIFFYGPASIEVIKPQKIEFTLDNFQDGLVDMTDMVHAYANYIMGLLNRKQVEEFNAKLYKGLRTSNSLSGMDEKTDHKSSFPEDLPSI